MPNVRLTPQMREFAAAEIAAGRYRDLSDVVRAALRTLMKERGAATSHRPEGEPAPRSGENEGGGLSGFDAKDCRVIGEWRIVGADIWDRDYLDLVGPAKLVIGGDGNGEIAFGAFEATLRIAYGRSDVAFTWHGSDEGDEVRGSGSAELLEDGTLEIEFDYEDGGDDAVLRAERAG